MTSTWLAVRLPISPPTCAGFQRTRGRTTTNTEPSREIPRCPTGLRQEKLSYKTIERHTTTTNKLIDTMRSSPITLVPGIIATTSPALGGQSILTPIHSRHGASRHSDEDELGFAARMPVSLMTSGVRGHSQLTIRYSTFRDLPVERIAARH